MHTPKINYDYLQPFKELPLILRILCLRRTRGQQSNNALIVNPSLIGDFASSLHSMRAYIETGKSNVDLVVSPQLKSLAKKVRGVRNVYSAKTLHSRDAEGNATSHSIPEKYDSVLVLRASKGAHQLLKTARFRHIKTSLRLYVPYFLNLVTCCFTKRKMKPYWEVGFDLISERPRKLPFEEIFDFSEVDYETVRRMPALRTDDKIVIIHTGSGWKMKLWDNKKWAELIQQLNRSGKFRFVFVGHEEEEEAYTEISNRLDFKTYSMIGNDVVELLLAMRIASYFIGVDSGPRNMAHVADLRSVTIVGPDHAMFPVFDKRDVLIAKSKSCDTLQLLFHSNTPHIDKIDVQEVYEAFLRLQES